MSKQTESSMDGTRIRTRGIFADWAIPKVPELPAWVASLQELNATDVVLGINHDSPTFRLNAAPEVIGEAAAAARQAGLKVHLMLWLYPEPDAIDSSADEIKRLTSTIPEVSSVLFDVEKGWIHATPPPSKDSADRVISAYAGIGVPLGVTSYAKLPGNVSVLVERVAYGLPQAYSLYTPHGKVHKGSAAAGLLQRLAFQSWSKHKPKVIMGLASYDQTGPGGVEQTMQAAVDETVNVGVDAVFYWSRKASTPQSREFIAQLGPSVR